MNGIFKLDELSVCAAADAPVLSIFEWPERPLVVLMTRSAEDQPQCLLLNSDHAFRIAARPNNVGVCTPCADRLFIEVDTAAVLTHNARIGSLAIFANGQHAIIVNDRGNMGFDETRYASLTTGRVLGEAEARTTSFAFESWKLWRTEANGSKQLVLDRTQPQE